MVEVLTSKELLSLSICRLIGYCKSKLQLMIAAQVKPLIIFDGCRLIMKSHTEAERRKLVSHQHLILFRNRREARDKAEEFMRQGNGMMAQRKFSESVDITPEIAFEFILVLKSMEVEYYVAPYEADA